MSAGCDRVLACRSEGRGPPNPVGIARPATTAPRLPAPRTERLPSLAGDLRREGLVIGARCLRGRPHSFTERHWPWTLTRRASPPFCAHEDGARLVAVG